MTPPSIPPPLAERVLAAAVPDAEWRESILGDLREEFAAVARASRRAMAARKWYWRQALAIGGSRRGRAR